MRSLDKKTDKVKGITIKIETMKTSKGYKHRVVPSVADNDSNQVYVNYAMRKNEITLLSSGDRYIGSKLVID
ncbi:hypothetical protein HY212_02865 [Candidatus Pacearchaeota archaeon]|nr:hypothetical protein [Candidatus Pacearchaeota archaeon]